MNNIKKIAVILSLLMIILNLTSCKKENKTIDNDNSNPSTSDTDTITDVDSEEIKVDTEESVSTENEDEENKDSDKAENDSSTTTTTTTTTATTTTTTNKNPTHEHSYLVNTVKPTCTQQGYTKHTCSCGHSYTNNYVIPTEHKWGSWTVTVNATTSSEGKKTQKCTVCGATQEQSIPKLTSSSPYDAVVTPNMTNEQLELFESRIIYYLSQYRTQSGLTALTEMKGVRKKYCRIRSEQLVTNYAHDPNDIASAEQQVGISYIYEGECISCCSFPISTITIDEYAQMIAEGYKESPSHWKIISSYPYISCGVKVIKEGEGITIYNCVISNELPFLF